MNIRKSFNLYELILSTIMLVVVAGLVYVLIIQGFAEVERVSLETNIERMNEATQGQIAELESKMVDWSWWDDTYKYLEDKNVEYEESNLQVSTLEGLNLRGMMLVNTKGEPLKIVGYDGDIAEDKPIPEELLEQFSPGSELLKFTDNMELKTGFLQAEGKAYMFAVRPVLTSGRLGPPRGSIVFIRNFDEIAIQKIADATKLEVNFVLGSKALPNNKQTNIELLDGKTARGSMILHDTWGDNLGILQFRQARTIYDQGRKSSNLIIVSLIALLCLTMVINYLILNQVVLRRLLKLGVEVQKLGQGQGKRVSVDKRDDELSRLSDDINMMLLRLESSNELAKTGKQNVHSYIDVVPIMIVAIDKQQKILLMNKKAGEVLSVEPAEVVGKNWFELFIPSEVRSKMVNNFGEIFAGEIKKHEIYENEVVTTKGERRVIAWHNSVMCDAEGEIVASLSSGEDITDLKQAEIEKEQRAQEIEKLNNLMVDREVKMAKMKEAMKNRGEI